MLIYFLGLIGVLSMYYGALLMYDTTGAFATSELLGKMMFGNVMKCTAIFLLFITLLENIRLGRIGRKIVTKLSAATLFIYLSHWMVLQFLLRQGWLLDGLGQEHIILTGFIYILTAYLAGFLFSLIFLQAIPWLKMRNAVLDALWPNRRIYVTRKKKGERTSKDGKSSAE